MPEPESQLPAYRVDTRLKNCPQCRHTAPRSAGLCSWCGYIFRNQAAFRPLPPPPIEGMPPLLPAGVRHVAPAAHDISTAVILSTLVSGGGQFYNRQGVKGVLLLLLPLLSFYLLGFTAVSVFLGMLFYVASIFDAASIAGRIVEGENIRQWHWF